MSEHNDNSPQPDTSTNWYELFSRGARDWLRHDEKVRASVREQLPDIIAGGDLINDGTRSIRVPVRMLEHYHFRLRETDEVEGIGQGNVEAGDILADPAAGQGAGPGGGGHEKGELKFMLELKIDDIVDWLWEELDLPNLQPRTGPNEDTEWTREGWDRRGARSRLDRRRSLRELLKRRGDSKDLPVFTDDDLRYRQLAQRPQPAVHAVVFFLLDVSGSMSARDRQLAKTFFFWAVQGLRREYPSLETVFVAHTTEAWEFTEPEFFQVTATGGTIASTGFAKVREIIDERYNPSRHNIYMFYASDGDNAVTDQPNAQKLLQSIAQDTSYAGYVEVSSSLVSSLDTETAHLFAEAKMAGLPVASSTIGNVDDVWSAVRHFFAAEQRALEGS